MREGWVENNLGKICKSSSGGTPSRKNSTYFNGVIPWVKSGELNYGLITDTKEHISEEAVQKSSAKIFPKGTLLIALYGATIGKLAILGVDSTTNQAVCGIYKNKILKTNFLYYFLFHNRQNLIDQGIGGAQPNISQTILKSLIVPIAPLPEQRAIVSKIEKLFSDLDNGIANLKKALEQLKVYRQAVLKKAFEGELTKEWREKQKDLPSADELLEQIKEEREKHYQQRLFNWEKEVEKWIENGKEGKKPKKIDKQKLVDGIERSDLLDFFRLSKNGKYFRIGELCDVVRGGSPRPAGDERYYNGSIPFLKVADLTRKKGMYVDSFTYTIKEAGLHKTRLLKKGTLVLSNSGATLGVPKITAIEATANDGIAAFIGLPESLKVYLYYFWNSKTTELRNIDQGAAQPNLNTDLIRNYIVPIFSNIEQSQIVQEIETRLSVCDNIESTIKESLKKSEALRQSILKKAFEGKLLNGSELEACRNEPDWEPAEKLLERIKSEKGK